jgi:hypothetical protein
MEVLGDGNSGDVPLTWSWGGSDVCLVSVLLIVHHNIQPRIAIQMIQIGRNFTFYNVGIPRLVRERIYMLEVSPQ